jgi:hypothetical protein
MADGPSHGDWQVVRHEIAEIFQRLEALEAAITLSEVEEQLDRKDQRHAIEKKSKPNATR